MATTQTGRHSATTRLSLRDTCKLLRALPLAAINDHELELLSEQLSQPSSLQLLPPLFPNHPKAAR